MARLEMPNASSATPVNCGKLPARGWKKIPIFSWTHKRFLRNGIDNYRSRLSEKAPNPARLALFFFPLLDS